MASDSEAGEIELLVDYAAANFARYSTECMLPTELKQTVLRAAEERILETPIISFKALARAQSTLEDFARTCVCAPLRLGATFP